MDTSLIRTLRSVPSVRGSTVLGLIYALFIRSSSIFSSYFTATLLFAACRIAPIFLEQSVRRARDTRDGRKRFLAHIFTRLNSLRSKRFRASSSRKLGREQKNKGMTGEEEGKEGNACRQTPRF